VSGNGVCSTAVLPAAGINGAATHKEERSETPIQLEQRGRLPLPTATALARAPSPSPRSTNWDENAEYAAGVIFGCTNSTFGECFELALVGLPGKYLPLVESIAKDKTLIFIFNFSDRLLHGVYRATSDGRENMSLSAWTGSSPCAKLAARVKDELPLALELEDEASAEDGSPFPAQCSFDILEEFAPLPESEVKHVLEYTERQRFKFKLSHWQCRDIVDAFVQQEARARLRKLLKVMAID